MVGLLLYNSIIESIILSLKKIFFLLNRTSMIQLSTVLSTSVGIFSISRVSRSTFHSSQTKERRRRPAR